MKPRQQMSSLLLREMLVDPQLINTDSPVLHNRQCRCFIRTVNNASLEVSFETYWFVLSVSRKKWGEIRLPSPVIARPLKPELVPYVNCLRKITCVYPVFFKSNIYSRYFSLLVQATRAYILPVYLWNGNFRYENGTPFDSLQTVLPHRTGIRNNKISDKG